MFFLYVWMLGSIIQITKEECSTGGFTELETSQHSFKCNDVSAENFLYKFYHIYEKFQDTWFDYELEITDSNFAEITSFLPPFPDTFVHRLVKFVLSNSLTEFIADSAFEKFTFVKSLSLSYNKLEDLSFVKTLPSKLEKLYLNGNRFKSITKVFDHFVWLEFLDLSNCKINTIDFNSFSKFYNIFINMSNNELETFDVVFKDRASLGLDLSLNKLNSINCVGNGIHLENLDLSFNDINDNICLNLLNSIGNLNLAYSKIKNNFNFELIKSVKGTINLCGNLLNILKPNTFGNNNRYSRVYLINASITDIEPNAFMSNTFEMINISSNPINILKNFAFNDSRIEVLDLSNCLLQKIETNGFFGLILSTSLNLSNNQLTYLNKYTFHNLEMIREIDLSFNILKKLDNNLFINCNNLNLLKLSNSKIEVVRSDSFIGPQNLTRIDLQNNFIKDITFRTSNLSVVNLQNNEFSNLQLSFLEKLSANVVLLSGNKIKKIINNTGSQTSVAKEIDLSDSDIGHIEPNSFRGLPILKILNLRDNVLDQILPGTFAPLKNLVHLDLTGNKIAYISPDAFAFGNSVKRLDVNFFGRNLTSFSFMNLNYLNTLRIVKSNFTSLDENCFKGLVYIQNLTLQDVQIAEIVPGAFNGLTNLKYIDSQILFRNVEQIVPGIFEGLGRVGLLDLSRLKISTIKPKSFSGLFNLKELFLNENKVSKIENNTFVGLKFVKILNLSCNQISEIETNAFLGLNNLTELYLTNNNITTLSLGTFQKFAFLKILNMSKNNISTFLTGTFSNLKYLEQLDLSYNNITKLKIENFFSLTNLKSLELSSNHLLELTHLELIKSLRKLEFVGLNNNRWKCPDLTSILIAFQNYSISWVSNRDAEFFQENIDGIKCFDVCKFFYCPEDYVFREQTL